ncbi:hypothetical protein LGN04_29930 [Burkholderia multivorans]|uniref:Uncharacterized protein n=1 Tax=Burkholderia multivorans TaxID=87883 RepID=A0AAP2MQ42_9BURK|nr:hypothetical protein [Burkholderia multivorans]MBU9245033.1 hypothetical protein [Burkholderia multivorans]MBU9345236.1 hypothetical protein [Burkholderia multivorans]MBU9358037.1 hypothetical protein [Burkholderia multivorans]MBU9362138.1 hypothetical protein [Burkholderia multivorans]MBU9598429.1 hypothetical protein [Burkholderia multivorans]
MQAGMGFGVNRGEWMVKKLIVAAASTIGIIFSSTLVMAGNESPDKISANSVENGCDLIFSKELHPLPNDPLSAPPYDVAAQWICRDGQDISFDKYAINGSSPTVATVLFWRRRYIVVLVKWTTNSSAADYVGDYYEVFVYRHQQVNGAASIAKDDAVTKLFSPGWDGYAKSGEKITYPYKDAASIRKLLKANNVR